MKTGNDYQSVICRYGTDKPFDYRQGYLAGFFVIIRSTHTFWIVILRGCIFDIAKQLAFKLAVFG